MKTFKTPKGTELPISDIKGKDYLQVAPRIHWFREEKQNWSIETEFVTLTDKMAIVKATIKDESGRVIQTAHKAEHAQHFADFSEKAETGAIGRAIANCGYGTLMALELDEGERIVDAPQIRPSVQPRPNTTQRTIVPSPASQRTPMQQAKPLINKADPEWLKGMGPKK